MSEEQNSAALRRAYEAFSTGNLTDLDDVIAADCVDHNPDPNQGPGLEGLKEAFTNLRAAVPDLRFTVDEMFGVGDKVVARATVSGTDRGGMLPGAPATGKSFSAPLIDIIRFADGKAVERWGLVAVFSMMQQLGAIPEPARTT